MALEISDIYITLGSTLNQTLLGKKALQKYFFEQENITSLLYLESNDCVFLHNKLIPMLPPTVRRIVATELGQPDEEYFEARARHERVQYIHLDILDPQLQVTEKFDCILSLWDVRWTHDVTLAFDNAQKLLKPNGFGLFLIESYNEFYKDISQKLLDTYREYDNSLFLLTGTPPFLDNADAIKKVSWALYYAGLRKEECSSEVNTVQFNSVHEFKESVHKSYVIGTTIPEALREEFYTRAHNAMRKQQVRRRDGGARFDAVIDNNILVTTFRNLPPVRNPEYPLYVHADKAEIYADINSNQHQTLLSKTLIETYLTELENITSILYLDCSFCDLDNFFHQTFIPMLPPNVTRIVVTQIGGMLNTLYNSENKDERISYIHMDILNTGLEVTEVFDCILSFWDVRWTHDPILAFKNVRSLMTPEGFGLFLTESHNDFYKKAAPFVLSRFPEYNDLNIYLIGVPPFVDGRDAIKKTSMALSCAGLRRLECNVQPDQVDFNTFKEFTDVADEAYALGNMLPKARRNDFYVRMYLAMTRLPGESRKPGVDFKAMLENQILVTKFKYLHPPPKLEPPPEPPFLQS